MPTADSHIFSHYASITKSRQIIVGWCCRSGVRMRAILSFSLNDATYFQTYMHTHNARLLLSFYPSFPFSKRSKKHIHVSSSTILSFQISYHTAASIPNCLLECVCYMSFFICFLFAHALLEYSVKDKNKYENHNGFTLLAIFTTKTA